MGFRDHGLDFFFVCALLGVWSHTGGGTTQISLSRWLLQRTPSLPLSRTQSLTHSLSLSLSLSLALSLSHTLNLSLSLALSLLISLSHTHTWSGMTRVSSSRWHLQRSSSPSSCWGREECVASARRPPNRNTEGSPRSVCERVFVRARECESVCERERAIVYRESVREREVAVGQHAHAAHATPSRPVFLYFLRPPVANKAPLRMPKGLFSVLLLGMEGCLKRHPCRGDFCSAAPLRPSVGALHAELERAVLPQLLSRSHVKTLSLASSEHQRDTWEQGRVETRERHLSERERDT